MIGPPLDREKLARVLGMLGSAHPGEIVAAAQQAERLRREAGLTWHDIVRPMLPPPPRERATMTTAEIVRFVLRHEEALTPWEVDFTLSIADQQYPVTEKQAAILDRLFAKAQRAARAA